MEGNSQQRPSTDICLSALGLFGCYLVISQISLPVVFNQGLTKLPRLVLNL